MNSDDSLLPVIDENTDGSESPETCSPTNYVTNEQAAIADEMRRLRTHAKLLRERIEATEDTAEKTRLLAELSELRQQRVCLVQLREQAIHRKMIMLGHEAPDPLL